ncbi:hypothetical protein QJS10_CPA06g01270 [Acorus calamus]|uniref:Uncharacterized protein n=1 Tax=Acorus calamus TaxID=4465 RepID=A0AAV9EKV0_ACOCL|nr:hypothetical protein QJS10_CPA06g01270 [Acorus calamus]
MLKGLRWLLRVAGRGSEWWTECTVVKEKWVREMMRECWRLKDHRDMDSGGGVDPLRSSAPAAAPHSAHWQRRR